MNIIKSSDLKNANIRKDVYEIPIYFFNRYEENALLSIKELLDSPENYFTEIYKPVKVKEKHNFVYVGSQPCYHTEYDCQRLNANYKNYEIPRDIREKGKNAVDAFRTWFNSVHYLLEIDPDVFVARLYARWGILTNVKAIEFKNSGATYFENESIGNLKFDITSLIKSAGRFYYASSKNKAILAAFSKLSFLGEKDEAIQNNKTGFSDEEVKSLLKYYHQTFKKPLKQKLIQYYRLDLNPEIEMSGNILNKLGFNPCNTCAN
ncbi:MAG: hypothetical protein H8E71_00615 [Candidatus Marinimicrobia bacterium]|nr:hypothetical protein [Candidatus Neomarinimicrobiota bacterium]